MGHTGCVARQHSYAQETSLRGWDSNMSLFPERLSVHTGSYWVVVRWHFQHHVTRENWSHRVWGGRTQNISLLPGRLTVHHGSYWVGSLTTQLFSKTSPRGWDSNMSLFLERLSAHTGSYWVVVRWHFQHHMTSENLSHRVWGGGTQNISLIPGRLTVQYGSYWVGSQTSQLFSRNQSEGVGFKHESIYRKNFCSYWVILGSGQVTLPTSCD